LLNVNNTGLIVVDFQGKLAQIVHESEKIHKKIEQLIKGVQLLELPIIWLEQYPEGLGPTTDNIKQLLEDNNQPIPKMTFSGCQTDEFKQTIEKIDIDNFLVVGVEAHICVYQTVRDLLKAGKHVEYVQDAISSRTLESKQIAISKMSLLGAFPTSVEMVLFELLKTAEHPHFREISHIIK